MSDDELILNFALAPVSDATPAQQPATFKGGRWKDRRNAKFKLQGREWKKASGVNTIDVSNNKFERLQKDYEKENEKSNDGKAERSIENTNTKRRELSKTSENRDNKRQAPEPLGLLAKKVKFSEKSGEFGGKNNSYVSSLFTSNKQSEKLQESASSETTYLPSNAPLSDASTFPGMGLSEKLCGHLKNNMRFIAPTKVQRAVAPQMINTNNDLFVKAQTGSGKTLAFLLPMIHRMMPEKTQINRQTGLFGIILTPTRELASQIYSVLETVLRCHHHIVPGIVVGGEKKKSEKARIRKGVNILVATPGRLADHLENTESLDVSENRWLILDEGDRLVELGFQETITKITDHLQRHSNIARSRNQWPILPNRIVNVLCSATMPEDVKQLGNTVLSEPQWISVDKDDEKYHGDATAPDQLVQKVMVVPPKLRLVTLAAILKRISKNYRTLTSRSMVFFSCSDSVNFHYEVFTRGGKPCHRKVQSEEEDSEDTEQCILTAPQIDDDTIVFRLHGSLSQQLRTSTLQKFANEGNTNEGKHLVLFCTDVASRGLDLPNIANVVEYDPPFTIDDHLHRIGRSARVGNKGEACLFLLPGEEEGYVEGKLRVVHPKEGSLRVVSYETVLKDSFSEKNIETPAVKGKASKDPKAKEGKWDMHATTWHLEVERWLLEDSKALERALHAFTSHIRAYATHLSSERNYFNVKLLHLGHLAKSFGLRETPKKLGRTMGASGSESSKKKEDPRRKMLRMAKLAEKAQTAEFNY